MRCAAYADASIRLAALLHDVGKPYCMQNAGNFIGHDAEGARIAEEICQRLKAQKKLTWEVVRLTALHMYDFRCDARENKVRKFIVRNYDVIDKLMLLKQADYSACADDFAEAPTVTKLKKICAQMREEGRPFTLKELAIRGNELIAAGLPANEAGRTLQLLLEDCATGAVENDKQKLLQRVERVYARRPRL